MLWELVSAWERGYSDLYHDIAHRVELNLHVYTSCVNHYAVTDTEIVTCNVIAEIPNLNNSCMTIPQYLSTVR